MTAPSVLSIRVPPEERPFVDVVTARLRKDPGDLDAWETLGVWLLYHGQAENALECFHRVTRRSPTYPGIWRVKAKAFDALGDAPNARLCRARGSDAQS